MYRILWVTLFYLSYAFAQAQHPFDWLVGTWRHPTKSNYEVWKKGDGEILLTCVSYRITASADTIVTEEIKFIREGDTYYYVPDVPENKGPVSFKVTEVNKTGFTAENPTHDFPKKIIYVYSKNENQLTVSISGDGTTIDFQFQKINTVKK